MDFSPKQEIPFLPFPSITLAQLKAYADASGDFNPIHQDEEVAKAMGLPGVIAHGMLLAGMVAERALRFMVEEQGVANATLVKYRNRFKSMVLLGDEISVGGIVKSVGTNEIVLDLKARNQRGEITTTGEAKFHF